MESLVLKLVDIVPGFSISNLFKSSTHIWITLLIVFILFAIGIFYTVKSLNKNNRSDNKDKRNNWLPLKGR